MPEERATIPVWKLRLGAEDIILAGYATYARTFSTTLCFDDIPAITQNPQIRDLTALRAVFLPGSVQGAGVGGRPVVTFSLAANYAISGEQVWSYHVFNPLVHLGAGLTLFGLVRRTLPRPVLGARFDAGVLPL